MLTHRVLRTVCWRLLIVVVCVTCVPAFDPGLCRAADWPMRGRDQSRNAVVPDGKGPVNWSFPDRDGDSKNVRWVAELGFNSQGDPVVSGGLVWVGTNNHRPGKRIEAETDASVLMCLDEKDGTVLYQYVSPRLERGEHREDWPLSGQCGSPLVEKDRLWFCNNRCEVICLNIGPLLARTGEPQVVWKVDMRAKFGVVPRAVMIQSNASHCSVAGYQDLIYVNTTNARVYKNVPAPDAPSLICFQKADGKVKWKDNSPGNNLLDVQQGSPLVMEVNGHPQVIMGQGDGWMRGFDALTGEVLWKFDFNHKSEETGPLHTGRRRNSLVAMPVEHNGHVYFATGRDYEQFTGRGRLCCLNPRGRGDISSQILDGQGRAIPNPNSGQIWEYVGTGDGETERLHRCLSGVVIHGGLAFVPDIEGLFHCVDARSGKSVWIHDLAATSMANPLIVGNKVYVGAESSFFIFELAREKKVLAEYELNFVLESGPVFANNVLYLMTRNKLTAIQER